MKDPQCSWTRALRNAVFSNLALRKFGAFTKFRNYFLHVMFAFLLSVNSNSKLTKFFSTKVVSLQRTTDTEPKKLQNLLGETIINAFFWAFFLNFTSCFFLPCFLILLVKTSIGFYSRIPILVKWQSHKYFVTSSFNWNRDSRIPIPVKRGRHNKFLWLPFY